jgi:hypothetical protein
MSASEHDIKVLTDSAVHGDGNPICDFLKPIAGLEERYAVLHAITEQNRNDRKTNAEIPELELYLHTGDDIRMILEGPSDVLYSEITVTAKSKDRPWHIAPDLLLPRTVLCAQRQ